jgi:hypothetical protein
MNYEVSPVDGEASPGLSCLVMHCRAYFYPDTHRHPWFLKNRYECRLGNGPRLTLDLGPWTLDFAAREPELHQIAPFSPVSFYETLAK